ncbi:MAG: HD domain-containing protein [Desulfobulbaceae bacterium]|nr:HD domain-containing protein [Desulfobulbaceae bacterium]
MQASVPKIAIDQLIDIVRAGGRVRTGIDIFNKQGQLLLEKDVLVFDVKIMENVKRLGAEWIPIVNGNAGGLWDKDGKQIGLPGAIPKVVERPQPPPKMQVSEIDHKINEIRELKGIAAKKYEHAKGCIKEALVSIQESGGEIDYAPIAETVTSLLDFLAKNDNAFSYLTREIFSSDDYLYNHSINVCTIGTVIMKKFNESFNTVVNSFLNNVPNNNLSESQQNEKSFSYFLPDDLRDISIGFFMHDLGKALIDKEILHKPGSLTEAEFEIMKTHSTEKGLELLEKNRLSNPYISNISVYHHANLYQDEPRCYPSGKNHTAIPPYAKVCKLADIYDAMTSKRCYKEALNPVGVVTDIFQKYAGKDPLLQYILHSFVKSVGIYPPGSIIALTNGQLAYVLDSQGPTLLPVTDVHGETLKGKPDIMVLDKESEAAGLKVDRRKPPISPLDAYKILPEYLLKTIQGAL